MGLCSVSEAITLFLLMKGRYLLKRARETNGLTTGLTLWGQHAKLTIRVSKRKLWAERIWWFWMTSALLFKV